MLVRTIYALIVVVLAASGSAIPSRAAESPCPAVLDHELVSLQNAPVSLCVIPVPDHCRGRRESKPPLKLPIC